MAYRALPLTLPDHRLGPVGLISEILRHTVDLSGAACIGRPELFDGENQTPEVFKVAAGLCRTCPVRARCREWSTENRAVAGVTAATTKVMRTYRPTSAEGDNPPPYRPSRNTNAAAATTDTTNHDRTA